MFERGHDLARVMLVPGEDGHTIDIRVIQHFLVGRGGVAKSITPGGVLRAQARGGGDTHQFRLPGLTHRGQEDCLGVVPRAQYANPHALSGGSNRARRGDFASHAAFVRGFRVGEQHAQEGLMCLAQDELVRLRGVADRKTVGDQGSYVDLAGCQQVNESLQIAVLGPAHVPDRVIHAHFFVAWIVPAGAVRTGYFELDFFFIVDLAWDVQPHRANRHHAAAIARQLPGEFDRVVGGGVSADQYVVKPASAGQPGGLSKTRFSVSRVEAHAVCQGDAVTSQVGAKHLAAGCPRDLGGEETQQAKPDHAHALTDLGGGKAETVQGDGSQGGEGCGFEIHVIRQVHHQILRDHPVLGVHGVPPASTGHPVAGLKISQVRRNLNDGPGG